jgi:polyferredoxin
VEWVGKRVIWKRQKKETVMPRWADGLLASLKYLLLAFFLWAIGGMGQAALEAFRHSSYNLAADAKMLLFFTDMSQTSALVLVLLVVLSMVVKNFWCRYLCPYGALLGLFSWASPQHVIREPSRCTDCKACTRACPVEIRVHKKLKVLTPECTGCLSCVSACPAKDCLTVTAKAPRRLSPYLVPAVGVGVIFLVWGIARLTGHWHSTVEPDKSIDAYRKAHTLSHP